MAAARNSNSTNFKSHGLRASAAVFSTKTKSSDNFLSGASSLYAEGMLEMYENDPNSVPEVSLILGFLCLLLYSIN